MKSYRRSALLVLSAAPGARAAADAAAASQAADLAKGQATATAGMRRLPHRRRLARQPANPILQGQHPEYLAKQLAEFKSGKRDNAIMKGLAATLSDDDMKNVSAFYAGKQAKPGFAKNKDLVAAGREDLPRRHRRAQVPACSGCHSPSGAGIPSQYPRLAGQHADYTEAQLIAFRGAARTTRR